jgi:hypothetical protein
MTRVCLDSLITPHRCISLSISPTSASFAGGGDLVNENPKPTWNLYLYLVSYLPEWMTRFLSLFSELNTERLSLIWVQ